MKDWKFKYMTEAQVAEIDKLWNDGHADALAAYGMECGNAAISGWTNGFVEGVGKALIKNSLITAVSIGVFAGAWYVGKRLVERMEDTEPEVKPERVWEA